jgi:hypothetical protein
MKKKYKGIGFDRRIKSSERIFSQSVYRELVNIKRVKIEGRNCSFKIWKPKLYNYEICRVKNIINIMDNLPWFCQKKKCIDFLVVSFHVNPILRLIRTQREKINKKNFEFTWTLLCYREIEDASHIFLSCNFSKQFWQHVVIWLGLAVNSHSFFGNWKHFMHSYVLDSDLLHLCIYFSFKNK